MEMARSTYYDQPAEGDRDGEILNRIKAIGEEFEAYGYRRICAELRHQGLVVNSKKLRRLMRESDLQPRQRRRYVATTDSDHEEPIFPNRAVELVPDGPDQLWVADITYVAILAGPPFSCAKRQYFFGKHGQGLGSTLTKTLKLPAA